MVTLENIWTRVCSELDPCSSDDNFLLKKFSITRKTAKTTTNFKI